SSHRSIRGAVGEDYLGSNGPGADAALRHGAHHVVEPEGARLAASRRRTVRAGPAESLLDVRENVLETTHTAETAEHAEIEFSAISARSALTFVVSNAGRSCTQRCRLRARDRSQARPGTSETRSYPCLALRT